MLHLIREPPHACPRHSRRPPSARPRFKLIWRGSSSGAQPRDPLASLQVRDKGEDHDGRDNLACGATGASWRAAERSGKWAHCARRAALCAAAGTASRPPQLSPLRDLSLSAHATQHMTSVQAALRLLCRCLIPFDLYDWFPLPELSRPPIVTLTYMRTPAAAATWQDSQTLVTPSNPCLQPAAQRAGGGLCRSFVTECKLESCLLTQDKALFCLCKGKRGGCSEGATKLSNGERGSMGQGKGGWLAGGWAR